MLQTDQQIAVTVVDEGVSRAASLAVGETLLKALQMAGVPIGSVCGGTMSCGTCHVYLDGQMGGPAGPTPNEVGLLEEHGDYRPGRSRLACQVIVTGSMADRLIEIAPEN